MRKSFTVFGIGGIFALAGILWTGSFSSEAAPRAGASGYHVIKTVPVPGDDGWDYVAVDSAARRVYISHGTHVVVMNADTYAIEGDIPDTPGVHGIAIASDLGRGFISSGRANTATIFDLKTLKTIGTVKTDANPDAITYDPVSKRVFTFNGRGKNTTAINAADGTVVGTLALGGKPEFTLEVKRRQMGVGANRAVIGDYSEDSLWLFTELVIGVTWSGGRRIGCGRIGNRGFSIPGCAFNRRVLALRRLILRDLRQPSTR